MTDHSVAFFSEDLYKTGKIELEFNLVFCLPFGLQEISCSCHSGRSRIP